MVYSPGVSPRDVCPEVACGEGVPAVGLQAFARRFDTSGSELAAAGVPGGLTAGAAGRDRIGRLRSR